MDEVDEFLNFENMVTGNGSLNAEIKQVRKVSPVVKRVDVYHIMVLTTLFMSLISGLNTNSSCKF